jgi:signal transduction histidine kinase
MSRSLSFKLTLAFLLVAATTAVLGAVFIRLTSADRLTQLILDQQSTDLKAILTNYYVTNGNWSGIQRDWRQVQQSGGVSFSTGPAHPGPGGKDQGGRNLFGLADEKGRVLVEFDPRFPVGANVTPDVLNAGTQILVDGKPVGTLLSASQFSGFNPQEALFLERTNQALILTSLGAMLAALIIGILLARTLTRPLQALTQAAQRIARGQLGQQVQVRSKDEIGQLAEAFNRMSSEVARSNQLRRQMTADIAHDLRTPLTVIGGYVESMRDGVLSPSPERLALIYAEIERLQDMVGDLRILSAAEAGELRMNPQKISPANLLERAGALFTHKAGQQGVAITVDAEDALPEVQVDEARVMQVLDNLLSNALRYTPPGGKIQIAGRSLKGEVEISIQDNGTGIRPEDLPHIFDRFYRADKSRHTDTGEAGLGLAIVKALVESNGGRVWAESQIGQGTTVYIAFPTPKLLF